MLTSILITLAILVLIVVLLVPVFFGSSREVRILENRQPPELVIPQEE